MEERFPESLSGRFSSVWQLWIRFKKWQNVLKARQRQPIWHLCDPQKAQTSRLLVGYSTNLWPNCPFKWNTGANWKSGRIKSLLCWDNPSSLQIAHFKSKATICCPYILSVFIIGGLFDLVLYQIVNLPICTLSVAFSGACNHLLESHFLNSLNRLFARPYTIMNRPLFAYQRACILLSGHFLQRATSQYGLAPVAV